MNTIGVITGFLEDWASGKQNALAKLIEQTHHELKKVARGQMSREKRQHTFVPTDLLHEAFIKLSDIQRPHFKNRKHFYALVAMLMRRILVEQARQKATLKRQGETFVLDMNQDIKGQQGRHTVDLIALDQVLNSLSDRDQRQAHLVELRFFGGFSLREVAELMDLSLRTVEREWSMAKTWLFAQLKRREAVYYA